MEDCKELPAVGDKLGSRKIIRRRTSRSMPGQSKFICFICNVETKLDSKSYNEGGLGRCSEERSYNKLKKHAEERNNPGICLEGAAQRFKLLLSGASHDVFAVDVYYHKKCYASFTRESTCWVQSEDQNKILETKQRVNETFFQLFEKKVLKGQEAYLMTGLLEDIKEISYDSALDEPSIKYSYKMKDKLKQRFGDKIDFDKSGRNKLYILAQ